LVSEFEKRVDLLKLDKKTAEQIKQLIIEVGKEYPCLTCGSRSKCENFKWHVKRFGKQE